MINQNPESDVYLNCAISDGMFSVEKAVIVVDAEGKQRSGLFQDVNISEHGLKVFVVELHYPTDALIQAQDSGGQGFFEGSRFRVKCSDLTNSLGEPIKPKATV